MANGLFNLKQVMQAVQQGGWPAQKTPAVEYLVVAGGGGGGYVAGGAGAGGLLQGIDPVPNGQTLLVTVGGGGAGGTSGAVGASGTNSVFGAISSTGGGAGGSYSGTAGASGGSGGGADTTSGNTLGGVVGQGTVGQGNAGGLSWSGSQFQGGGGGGAGTVGLNAIAADSTAAGNGGAGIASAISGTVTTYAGGGGGASDSGSVAGNGGVGGGGAGGASRGSTGGTGTVNGGNGTANTGGGAGSYGVGGTGGTGGSGIVIVSYPDVYAAATATTGSPTVSTSGSGSILFNGSTQYLQYPDNTAYDFGSGDFTIEAWIYVTGSGRRAICGQADSGGTDANTSFYFEINSGGFLRGAVVSSSTTYEAVDPTAFTTNQWVNVAFVRNGSVLRLYKAGVQVAATTAAVTVNNSAYRFGVGSLGEYVAASLFGGNITNLRIVKGTCLYPSGTTYTPSTTPLTVVSGTSILLSAASGAFTADSSTNSFAPSTATVIPAWNALSPFTGTGYKNRVYTWTSSGSITF